MYCCSMKRFPINIISLILRRATLNFLYHVQIWVFPIYSNMEHHLHYKVLHIAVLLPLLYPSLPTLRQVPDSHTEVAHA